jgi:hypothetical protein
MADPPRSPETGDDTGVGPDRGEGMPRWVKVSGIIVIILVLLVGIMLLIGGGGGHGPRRHTPSGDPGGQTAPSSVTAPGGVGGHTPPAGGHTP